MKLNRELIKNKLVFLGTAGSRYVAFGFLRQAGGLYFNFDGVNFHVDPGPGAFVYSHKKGIESYWTDYVAISHRHLDHCADVNHIIEGMTLGGKRKKGTLFCPEDAISHDPVVLEYSRNNLEKVEIIKEGRKFQLSDTLSLSFPLRNHHRVETYGLLFIWKIKIAYLSDTKFFEDILDVYKGVDLLILNVTMKKKNPSIDHLSAEEVPYIIEAIKPSLSIMTHFGRTMVTEKPWLIAEEITNKTKIKTIAAYDNMIVDLDNLSIVKQR